MTSFCKHSYSALDLANLHHEHDRQSYNPCSAPRIPISTDIPIGVYYVSALNRQPPIISSYIHTTHNHAFQLLFPAIFYALKANFAS